MNLKHLRLNFFYKLLKPFSDKHRANRMRKFSDFLTQCNLSNPRILDLGGQPGIWAFVDRPLNITILNLPGITVPTEQTIHTIEYVEGDACNVSQYGEASFDIVFSNSVIEHVGDDLNQERFAKEVHRLARYYWIQTPSKYFPIEAHCGMPFWWFWPKWLRAAFILRWREKTPKWTEMVEGTRVLSKQRMKELFPRSEITTERAIGFVKSYIAHN